MVRCEYVSAGCMRIGDMDVLPFVEIRVEVSAAASLQTCLAEARPVGFALLAPAGGYWVASPQDLTLLAAAVRTLFGDSDVQAAV